MVREVTFKLYRFDELNDKVREKVLKDNRYILVDDTEWYYGIYNYAENIGFRIRSFDDVKFQYINMDLITSVLFSVEETLKCFNEGSRLYNIAKSYYDAIMRFGENSEDVKDYLNDYPNEDVYDAIYSLGLYDIFRDDYVGDMADVFLQMLENEFCNLTSDEAIINFFICKDCEFFENGKLFKEEEFRNEENT